jgi:hypothetical protein
MKLPRNPSHVDIDEAITLALIEAYRTTPSKLLTLVEQSNITQLVRCATDTFPPKSQISKQYTAIVLILKLADWVARLSGLNALKNAAILRTMVDLKPCNPSMKLAE